MIEGVKMTVEYFLKKIKDVKLRDYFSFFSLAIALIMMPFYKKYKGCWVVCETPLEARDNGYHFFKYMRTHMPQKACYYAIKKKSVDYKKVSKFGNIIEYGSIKHWLLYLNAEYNISSQKGGKPNTAVCSFLELTGKMDSKLVFLQHGITINNCSWAHADTTKLKYFITSTKQEYAYIQDTFGFPKDRIVLTGMPRFDNLHDQVSEDRYVLIMPTWRSRFSLVSQHQRQDNEFNSSIYKHAWEEFLNCNEFTNLIRQYDLKVVFFPHRNMQSFLSDFNILDEKIIIGDWEKYDIQEELKKAAVMITDYSSVFFDMVYMKKPVLFYQFDYDDFRKYDYQEGYFNYKNTPFGKWCDSSVTLCEYLKKLFKNGIHVDSEFENEHNRTFPFYDDKNSERIANILLKNGMRKVI